jgi:2-dehydropantoate 2-reductase
LQNGVVKDQELAAAFGQQAVLGAAADFSAEVDPNGSVLFTRNEGFHIGELPAGISSRVLDIVDVLIASGIKATASERIQTVEWSKFVAWVSLAPLSVLTRLATHRILQDPDLALLHVKLAKEVGELADRLGIELEDLVKVAPAKTLSALRLEDAISHQQAAGQAMELSGVTSHRLSSLQDLERGRRLEVEETMGFAVRRAEEAGLQLAAVEHCYRLMAGVSRSLA